MTEVSSATSSTSTSSTAATSSTADSESIDWNALVEEAVNAKLSKADNIDLRVTNNEIKIAAYQKMQSLLNSVSDAAQALRADSGVSSVSGNVFASRAAYLTANGDVDASATLSATVENGASTGTHELIVSQLAKAHKVIGTALTGKSDDLGYDGVMSLGTDAGASVQITINANMSLAEVAEAINAKSDESGVKASIIKVSDSDYRLVLSSTETGETIIASNVSGDEVLKNIGILDTGGAFTQELQAAQQAIFTIDGVEITRSSNDVDDLLDGISLHLYQITPDGTSITLEVGTDLSAVKDAVVALADAYNAYREFAFAQQQLPNSNDEEGQTALFGDGILRAENSALAYALTARIGEASLATLGLTFDSNNQLELDVDVLDAVLLNDPEGVEELLAFQMTSSSTKLMLLSRGTEVPEDFKLDITVDANGEIVSAGVDGDTSLFTINGTRITGAAGSIYEGYTFVYSGNVSQSSDISFNTGLAELLYNATNTAINETDGSLTTSIEGLKTTNDDLQIKSDDIHARAKTYRTNLTNRYAKYQAAISTAQSSLDYLSTLISSWNSSS